MMYKNEKERNTGQIRITWQLEIIHLIIDGPNMNKYIILIIFLASRYCYWKILQTFR